MSPPASRWHASASKPLPSTSAPASCVLALVAAGGWSCFWLQAHLIESMIRHIECQIENPKTFHRKLLLSELSLGLVEDCNQVKRKHACSNFVFCLGPSPPRSVMLVSWTDLAYLLSMTQEVIVKHIDSRYVSFLPAYHWNSLFNILSPLVLIRAHFKDRSHNWNEYIFFVIRECLFRKSQR